MLIQTLLSRSTRYFFLVLSFTLLSGCFELKEELLIEKGGSGSYQMVVDFSGHKTLLDELSRKAKEANQPLFDGKSGEMKALFELWSESTSQLGELKGINRAREISDSVNYRFGFAFDFEDIGALNLALVMQNGGNYDGSFQLPYSFEKNKLVKNEVFMFGKLFEQLRGNEDDSPDLIRQKEAIFSQIRYTCVLKTRGKVKKNTNPAYQPSDDKRAVALKTYLSEVYQGTRKAGTSMKFK